MFELIKTYYTKGYWPIKWVKNAVVRNVITAAQYKEITGEDYVA